VTAKEKQRREDKRFRWRRYKVGTIDSQTTFLLTPPI
jgi:hypothetical protein